MSIVRCTAYPFRYAEEAYAESADEADALELFDSSLYTGMFSIDFDTRRAGRPCLDGTGRKRNLAQQIGKAWQARPVYCRKTGAYEVGGWNVAGANCGHESAVFSPPFPMEDRERVFAVLDALQSDGFLPVDGFTIHMIPAEPNRQTILNMCNILQSRSELIAQGLCCLAIAWTRTESTASWEKKPRWCGRRSHCTSTDIRTMAFELFNQGMGYQKIAEAITAAGGKRMRGSTAFSASSIQSIVDNEIYVGDRMLQKRPPQHYLTKKPDPNAQYQTYYWRDTHEGIIDRKTWEKAQTVLDARKRDRISGVYKKTPATHFLYGKVFCARCGAPYKRRTLSGGTADGAPVYHKVWNCRERQKGKAGNGCRNTSVAEEELLRGISDALGWEWKGAEVFDTERFLREVQAVHLENGAVSVQKWTQRVSA